MVRFQVVVSGLMVLLASGTVIASVQNFNCTASGNPWTVSVAVDNGGGAGGGAGAEVIRVSANISESGVTARPLEQYCNSEFYGLHCTSVTDVDRFEIYPSVGFDLKVQKASVVVWPKQGLEVNTLVLKSCAVVSPDPY